MTVPIDRRQALAGGSSAALLTVAADPDRAHARADGAVAPHGRVIDVALARDVAAIDVAAGTVAIRTTGFARPGVGGALYVAIGGDDPDLPGVVTRNGRHFRLADDELRAIRPEVLGAIGDGAVVIEGQAARFTGHDDGPAISAAFRVAMRLGGEVVLAARRYRIAQPLAPITSAMAVRGAGSLKTWLLFDPAADGDAISIVETWMGRDPTETGPAARMTAQPAGQASGVTLTGFTLSGSRATTQRQNGLMLYERNDNLHLSDIEIRHIKGRGFWSGASRRSPPTSLLRESRIDRLQVRRCGDKDAGLPAFELSCDGYRPHDDATNNLSITDLLVIYSSGRAVVMENRVARNDMRFISITGAFVEGADQTLWTVRGSITNMEVSGFELNGLRDPAQPALVFEAGPRDAIARPPRQCTFAGSLGTVADGILIRQGKDLRFRLTQNGASGMAVTVGEQCTGAILFEGGADERRYRLDIHPRVRDYVTVEPGQRVWSARTLPDPAALPNATIVVRDIGEGQMAFARSDGQAWYYAPMQPVPLPRGGMPPAPASDP